jgi:hypothetical protein
MITTFKTSINVYNPVLDAEFETIVVVTYCHEIAVRPTLYDPGEAEVFDFISIVDAASGKELTENEIDMVVVCEELEAEIRAFYADQENF